MKRFEIFFGIIKIPTDFLMTIAGFYTAYRLRLLTSPNTLFAKPIDYTALPTIQDYLQFSVTASIVLLIIFAIGQMYSLRSTSKFSQEAGRATFLCGVWIMALITYFFFIHSFPFSRLATAYSWILTLFFILTGRGAIKIIQNIFLRSNFGKRTLLVIGKNNISKELIATLSHTSGYKILEPVGKSESLQRLEYIIKRSRVDEIIQTESENQDILELCDTYHVHYRFVPDMLEVRRSNIEIETIGEIPIISLKPTPLDGWGKVLKRLVDIIGSLLGIIVLSPIFLITAIAIKLDSKGPVFFTKLDDGSPAKRVGQHHKLFQFYKFRSMKNKTDGLRSNLTNQNLRSDGPLMKIKDDPRITRVGRFIRRYSIDELPQLYSVLKGDMSLVGPRPHLPEEVAKYDRHHHFVFTIKPGLSGLAQISGRSDLDFATEAKLDRFYIENWSLLLDIKIILKTLGVIAKGYRE